MKTKIRITSQTFFLIIMLFLLSCSKKEEDPVTDPVPIDLTEAQAIIIESGNEFAFDIFGKVIEKAEPVQNVMISPLSISYALSMTINGAAGETSDAMQEALRISGIDTETLNKSYKALTDALLTIDKRVLISIANSVWTEDDFEVKKAFTDVLTSYYDAEAQSFDIDDPLAPGLMNNWIEDKTNGLIKEMISKLPDNTVMLLINAIYFKGQWKLKFDESKTVDEAFFTTGSSQVTVPMMKQKKDFKVYEENGFKIAEFPYGQGNYVMDVILPDEKEGLNNTLAIINSRDYELWVDQMAEQEIVVSFPRFKYGYKRSLKDILSDMGMGIAFTDNADFSNISEQFDLLLNDVAHQTFIETNEEGTEAAAATVVTVGTTSMPPPPLEFKMDHPFLYIIRETSTNSILFMGRVSDPSVN
ncbi:MAG: serpin family protein [Bacteroidales bacterium]|nr:serpin family protein [Bacteroidales bacterium]